MDDNNGNDTKVSSLTVEKGKRQTEFHEGGGVSFNGPDGVALYRLLTIKMGLELEMKGMRLTSRAPKCFTIIKKEFGLKGRNKRKMYEQFCEMHGFAVKPEMK